MSPFLTRQGLRACLAVVIFALTALTGAARERIAEPGELSALLTTAQPGDVILLAAGDHGAVVLDDTSPADLTLAALDPTDRPIFRSLLVQGVSGLVLREIDLRYAQDDRDVPEYQAFRLIDLDGATLRGLNVIGDTVDRPEGQGLAVSVGLYLENVTDVVVESSRFETLYRGLEINGAETLDVTGSTFERIRDTGLRLTDVSEVLIEANTFAHFMGTPGRDTLPQMIGIETKHESNRSRQIVIRGNLLTAGIGPKTRSIVLRTHARGTGAYFRDIIIEENVILNAHIDGITVGEVEGLIIQRNSVLRAAHAQGRTTDPSTWTPAIEVDGRSRHVVILGNVAHVLPKTTWKADWTIAGNVLVQDRVLSEPNFYDDVFHAVTPNRPPRLSDYAPRPGGPLDGRAVGAPMLSQMTPPDPSTEPRLKDGEPWRAIWLDPDERAIKARTGAGRKLEALELAAPDIYMGSEHFSLELSRGMTAPIYGAEAIWLSIGLQAGDTDRHPSGEVLRIHESLLIKVSQRGILEAHIQTVGADWVRVRSRDRLRFSPDQTTPVDIRYDAKTGVISLHDGDGQIIGRGQTEGNLKAPEFWGLSIGNPFGDRPSFTGRITALSIDVRHSTQREAEAQP